MTVAPLVKVVQGLRLVALKTAPSGVSDADLIRAFLSTRDEKAFETLVVRHGPMVLGVCRRVLRNDHDAEDAFQATFMVLARRAESIRPQGMVGNWLYGVAERTAMRTRRYIARRREIESAAEYRIETETPDSLDLSEALGQELSQLPEKLRVALLLCDIQGRTRRNVAHELGLAEGTVASRVARARVILAKRLVRKGITLSASSVAVSLAQQAIANVSPSLVSATVKGALGKTAVSATVLALTEGVLRTMFMSKLRNVLGVVFALSLCLAGLGYQGGAGTVSGQSETPQPIARSGNSGQEPAKNTIRVLVDLEAVDATGRTLTAIDVTGMPTTGKMVFDLKLGNDGTVANVKIDNIKLELVATSKRAKFSNLPIAKDAKVTGNGKDLKLADLKPGRAELEMAVGPRGLQVVGVRIEPTKEK